MIMSASRASQSTAAFPRATKEAKHILIIGAEGGMGTLYGNTIIQSEHKLYKIDKHNWHELEAIAPELDLAIVSVPIHNTAAVIKRLAPKLDEQTMLADFTSNKTRPIKDMKKNHSGPIVGLHPMHGPDVQNLSKQLMVWCPVQESERASWFKEQCRLWGMRVIEAEAEKHDHVMNLVQGLRHF